jgi:serine/threonine-protein kinase HipA
MSPAYDLTFNTGTANCHTTSINGAGNPTFADLKKVATERQIKDWQHVLDQVRSAVSRWPEFARNYDMAKSRVAAIKKELLVIDRACAPS